MPKKTLCHGAYVKVDVDPPFKKEITPRDWCNAAGDLMSDIKRHCDGIKSLTVELDTEEVCEFCGYQWTEVSDTRNECCEEDILAHEAWMEMTNPKAVDMAPT